MHLLPVSAYPIAVLGLLGLLLSGCVADKSTASATPQTPPPAVTIATLTLGSVTEWNEFTGHLEAVERVEIKPRVNGYLDQVLFEEGSQVKQGQLLCIIDPRPFQAEVNRAQAELQRTMAHADWAKRELVRLEKLLTANAVSSDKVDLQRTTLLESQASVGVAQAQLDSAELNLAFTQIKSPITGRIGHKRVSVGNLVNAPSGGAATVIAEIIGLNPLYVGFEVDENTWNQQRTLHVLGKAPPVEVRVGPGGTAVLRGKLDFSDTQVNRQTGTLKLRAILDNPEDLWLPGMFARVRLAASVEYAAILLDEQAILTDQSTRYVLVVNTENKADYRAVKLGPLMSGQRVIRTGLAPGDRVIINGMQRVRPGMTVQPTPGG